MVRTSFRGTHNWPEASQFAGKEVEFLEHEHRHTFHVLVELQVTDSDREVEFFVFQEQVDRAISNLDKNSHIGGRLALRLGRRSCETMAEEIIYFLREKYHYKGPLTAEVWEDNEVGARISSLKCT